MPLFFVAESCIPNREARAAELVILPLIRSALKRRLRFVFRGRDKFWLEISRGDDAILSVIGCSELGGSFRVGAVPLLDLEVSAKWRGSQVVRQRSAKPLSSVRFRPAPPIFLKHRQSARGVVYECLQNWTIEKACSTAAASSPDRSGERTGRSACATVARSSLHFVGTASKLFLLLTRKGLTLGC